MKARFTSMLPNASSVAARRMYGDFGAPWPLVVLVVVSDIDPFIKHPSVLAGGFPVLVGLAGAAEAVPSVSRRSTPFSGARPGSPQFRWREPSGGPQGQRS